MVLGGHSMELVNPDELATDNSLRTFVSDKARQTHDGFEASFKHDLHVLSMSDES